MTPPFYQYITDKLDAFVSLDQWLQDHAVLNERARIALHEWAFKQARTQPLCSMQNAHTIDQDVDAIQHVDARGITTIRFRAAYLEDTLAVFDGLGGWHAQHVLDMLFDAQHEACGLDSMRFQSMADFVIAHAPKSQWEELCREMTLAIEALPYVEDRIVATVIDIDRSRLVADCYLPTWLLSFAFKLCQRRAAADAADMAH